jgi:hypothetical protein
MGGGPGLRVNEVDADEFVLDQDFALLELRHGQVGLIL